MSDKKSFVESELMLVLKRADHTIKTVEYIINNDIELVHIQYISGHNVMVNVTGDSHIGILYDVAKTLIN